MVDDRQRYFTPTSAAITIAAIELLATVGVVIYRHYIFARIIGGIIIFIILISILVLLTFLAKRHISSIMLIISFLVISILMMLMLYAVEYFGIGLKNSTPNGDTTTQLFDCFYFSVVTWTTLGYGDLSPASRGARWWAMTEVLTGYAVMSLVIAVLVTVLGQRYVTSTLLAN